MTRELKPCPFCGGDASIARDHCIDGGGIFLSVKCHTCRAKSGEKYHSHGNDCPQTYQEVRDAWNTRAEAAEAALPAVYRLALEDVYRLMRPMLRSLIAREHAMQNIRELPTPTAAELMARINEGEKE